MAAARGGRARGVQRLPEDKRPDCNSLLPTVLGRLVRSRFSARHRARWQRPRRQNLGSPGEIDARRQPPRWPVGCQADTCPACRACLDFPPAATIHRRRGRRRGNPIGSDRSPQRVAMQRHARNYHLADRRAGLGESGCRGQLADAWRCSAFWRRRAAGDVGRNRRRASRLRSSRRQRPPRATPCGGGPSSSSRRPPRPICRSSFNWAPIGLISS